jgi:hypothetical protein
LKSLVYSKSEADTLLSSKASSSHKHTKSEITDFPTIPTKTSQLTNDSGFLTSHQSLSNYSTLANTVKSLSISGKTITVTPGSGKAYTLTTQDTNTTYSNFVKSGSGAAAGLVPAPSTTAGTTKYLREDGTWQVPPDHTYTVNNATLTIQKNGSNVATFTANASSNATANITVPTKVSQLTNDSGFLNYSVKNKTGIGSLGYVNDATDNVLITSNTLAYWDGAYSGTTSNLTYCKKGAFGDIVTHNASEFLSVTRGSSISTGGSGYWAAMCNSSETGSPTLPTTNQWWHVLSMDWSGNSNNVTDWCSQLALPTQQNSCLYWRRNNSGGTSINNSTWHKVIDDTNIGSQSVNYANSAGSAGSASSATYAGYVQGDKSTGLYVNSVKYGNALVTTNQSDFGAIWNAPTKNYRVACTTYPNANDDVYLCYSVTNANVSSSTNTVSKECVWNANDGTLRTANVKATSGLYYNSYRIYVG